MLYAFVFVFSLLAVYITIRVARRFSVYDVQDGRRLHDGNIPRLGGVGIFLGFIAGIVASILLEGGPYEGYLSLRHVIVYYAAALIFAMGFVDDIKHIKARYKLAVQLAAGIALCACGFKFTRISFAPLNLSLNLGVFSWAVTVLWIAVIINAVNMFDGLDGLAGTTSLIVFSSYAVFFFRSGLPGAFLACTMLLPAIAGFLAFNLPFPKAKIFMGDCGSNFLGFMLAALPLFQNASGLPTVPVWYAATLIVFPACDFIAAIWRRLRDRRSIMSPDFLHIHHKLIKIGFSQRQTLALLVALQTATAALVLTAYFSGGVIALAILISIWVIAAIFFTVVHINSKNAAAPKNNRGVN